MISERGTTNRMSTTSPQRPRSGGFTLVELLIVAGIVGILGSILVPSIPKDAWKYAQGGFSTNQQVGGAYGYR